MAMCQLQNCQKRQKTGLLNTTQSYEPHFLMPVYDEQQSYQDMDDNMYELLAIQKA